MAKAMFRRMMLVSMLTNLWDQITTILCTSWRQSIWVASQTDSRAKVSLFAIGAFNPARIDRGAFFPTRSLRARFGVRRFYVPQGPAYMVMLFEKNLAPFGILPRGVEIKISSFAVGDARPGHPTHLTSEKAKKSVSPDLNDDECALVSELLHCWHSVAGWETLTCVVCRQGTLWLDLYLVVTGLKLIFFISSRQDGVLREGQFPSVCTDDQMSYAYRYTPTPAGGGANVALRGEMKNHIKIIISRLAPFLRDEKKHYLDNPKGWWLASLKSDGSPSKSGIYCISRGINRYTLRWWCLGCPITETRRISIQVPSNHSHKVSQDLKDIFMEVKDLGYQSLFPIRIIQEKKTCEIILINCLSLKHIVIRHIWISRTSFRIWNHSFWINESYRILKFLSIFWWVGWRLLDWMTMHPLNTVVCFFLRVALVAGTVELTATGWDTRERRPMDFTEIWGLDGLPSLKLNSELTPKKMDGWKTIRSSWGNLFSGAMQVYAIFGSWCDLRW